MSRPTIAEIDLSAIAFNLAQVRALVGPDLLICPAVKADGYGHGAVEVSRTLLDGGAEMLGVATVEEVAELRDAGIAAPMLLLGCILPDQAEEIVRYDITTAVCDLHLARELSRQASTMGRTAQVHIKVDTGMGRIGIRPGECADFAVEVSRLPGIHVEGIFTHFPCADEDDQCFTLAQSAEFEEIACAVETALGRTLIKHAANSGAVVNTPGSYLDMVRPGIMVYGLYDSCMSRAVELRQAMTLRTGIVFLKDLPPGSTVSYGRTFEAARPTRVATIPIGYADGYSRGLSNKAHALVRGMRVPVIGRVCMDQTMLDVTDVPGAGVGDEVVLYGSQGDEHIGIEEIASLLGTITYEVSCSVSKRVPRVYLHSQE